MRSFFIIFLPDIIQQLVKLRMKPASKRQRTMTEGIIELLQVARVIWKREKDVVRSTQQEDREFRSMFGVGAITAITAYNMLIVNRLMPSGGLMMHFLWAMIFLKGYAKEGTICKLAGVDDPKTLRKWRWPFITALAYLESSVVRTSSKCLLLSWLHLFLICFAIVDSV